MPTKPILYTSKVERIGHLFALVIGKNRGRTPLDIQNSLYTLMNHLFEEHDRCPLSKNPGVTFKGASQFKLRIPLIHFTKSDNPI